MKTIKKVNNECCHLTLFVASINSTASWHDHCCNVVHAFWSTSESILLRPSGPNILNTMFLTYLNTTPCRELKFCFPRISFSVSGYQLLNISPSCWNIKWLNFGSVDTTVGLPAKPVLKIGPYLKRNETNERNLCSISVLLQIPYENLCHLNLSQLMYL